MCVLCMFYVDWEVVGRKKLKGRDFVRVGLQEKKTFFFSPNQIKGKGAVCHSEVRCSR